MRISKSRPINMAIASVLGLILGAVASAAPPTFEERLDTLVDRLEAARIEHHIPGMAIAVVKDDKVVLARGFGLANIETEQAVTPETIFAIGSTTKAFTATLIGMLVDEGRINWDDPVSNYLPYFELGVDSEDDDAVILLRDMLCHRTGYTRMSMLFASGEASRNDILLTANGAESWKGYREQFLYNNVMFMAAGMSAGVAAESSWEELMQTRLLEPLGMNDVTLTIAEAKLEPRLSLGYTWDSEKETWDHAPMRDIDAIGPAGSVNAHVLDAAQWIRFQLGRGKFEGTRLISEESHAETWKPQMTIAPDIVDYGFGWMLQKWNDKQVVEHGGNIDGFAAQISLLPDEELGYVLLCNTSFSPLQQGSISLVFNTLVGDWPAEDAEQSDLAGDLERFAGVYMANYALFEDEAFTVAVNDDGQLTIDIPSQRMFILDTPGEDGRRQFVEPAGLAASFEDDESGQVAILRLYQGGLQFDVPVKGYEYPVEVPLGQLDKYLGTYHIDAINDDATVLIRHNHLAVDVPGQMVFELRPPDDEGRWVFRNSDVITLSLMFNELEFGEVESITMFQPNGAELVLPRVAGHVATDLPTLEEVFDLCGLDARQTALDAAGIVVLTGTTRFAQSGLTGSYAQVFNGTDRFKVEIDCGKFGSIRSSMLGARAWSHVSFDRFRVLEGRLLELAKREHPRGYLGDWRGLYDDIRVDSVGELDGRKTIVLKLGHEDDPPSTFHLDAVTGDLLKIRTAQEIPGLGGVRIPITTTLGQWTEVNGLRLPMEMTVETQQNGRMVVNITDTQTGVELEDDHFVLHE